MRCCYCDYSPSAPSLSSVTPKNGVHLAWDETVQGWHCNGGCSDCQEDITDNPFIEEELVEVIEIPPTMPETGM